MVIASGPSMFSSTSTDCTASASAAEAGIPATCSLKETVMSGSGHRDRDEGPRGERPRDHRVVRVADPPERGRVVQVLEGEQVEPVGAAARGVAEQGPPRRAPRCGGGGGGASSCLPSGSVTW